MKRKFSKILGVGLTLALLASLLFTAAPVSADVSDVKVDVDDNEIGAASAYDIIFDLNDELETYTLYEGTTMGTAAWSDGPEGDEARSVLLTKHASNAGSVYVEIAPPSGITFAEFADNLDGYSFDYYLSEAPGPQLELKFVDPDDDTYFVEMTVMPAQGAHATIGDWETETLAASTISVLYYGEDDGGGFDSMAGGGGQTLESAITGINDDTEDASLSWELERVRLELWEAGVRTCYIDDIIIDGDEAEISTITIEFPEGTEFVENDADDDDADDDVYEWDNDDVTVRSTQGWGESNNETDVGDDVVVNGDDLTVTIGLGQLSNNIGENATVEVAFAAGTIINPDEPGDYTLELSTSAETDEVASGPYEIEVPDVGVLSGIVELYNNADPAILMGQDTGDSAINDMIGDAGEDYTILVGPGEYEITDTLLLELDGLTLESSDGAEDTIIVVDGDLDGDAIQITADDVTVDGFTIEDTASGYTAINVTGDDATVENNVITADDGYPAGIWITAEGATVSGNELDIAHTMMVIGATDSELSGNTFGAGINVQGSTGIDITGNEIIGSEFTGIVFESSASSEILIEGNTISETVDAEGTGIYFRDQTLTHDQIQIIGNEITDNEGPGIWITATNTLTNSTIKFNTITGNDADNDGYGIQNDDAEEATLDATLNWWGTAVADDVADMVNDTDEGETIYEPFLADTAEAVFSASEVAVDADSLDAEEEVGVEVSGATDATVISVAKYVANPEEAIDDAIAFFDVYVVGVADDDDVTIKFYAGDEHSTLHVWSADTQVWVDLSEDETFGFSVYGGYMYIDYDPAMLAGTPFALVGGEAEIVELDAPKIAAPVSGTDDVSLTPTFAWTPGADADAEGYYFQLADNANFVAPLVKLDGDLGRLIVSAYAYVTELPYSTPYYWRVKAVSGTIAADDLVESEWTSGVFITMDEPPLVPEEPEPEPRMWTCPQCGLTYSTRAKLEAHAGWAHLPEEPADIIITSPDIEVIVPLPDVVETAITPTWIYVIIAVGGVLVIALLVLIVRTRRVA